MTRGPERMRQASQNLGEIAGTIDRGRSGTTIAFPLSQAALILRIPTQTLENLQKREQVLGISIKQDIVTIELRGNPRQQKEAYSFLYGLIQNYKDGRAGLFLKTKKVPDSLAKEDPDLGETIAVIKKGKCDLPEEDLAVLHLQLWGRWQSLRDKSGLFPPEKVFS